ncbi:hypothetical protein DFH29DRAFT_1000134 [Suillus ampliporus]|nr:hypothetical protein DFH29DRAFT_1000134 [Suillus ampliporus]
MSCPQMRPSNVNKHPGNIVQEANRVQRRSKEEVAAEKNCKQAEKNARAAAVDKSRTMIAAAEDAMAIQQKTQVKGPPKLIRPRMVTSKKSTNVANADAQPAVIAIQSTAAPEDDGQAGQPVKKKHAALKLNFRDSVNANRKVSNGGVTIITGDSDTRVGKLTLYYFDYICAHQISTNPKQVISSDLEGPIPNWVDKVASQTQLKPSAPPSAQTSVRTGRIAESDVDLDDEPEEYSEPAPKSYRGKNIVHVNETLKSTARGKKRLLSNAESSADELEVLNATEELEILEDLEAAEEFEMVEDRESAEEGDESDRAMMVDHDQPTINTQASVAQRTSSMLVDVSEQKTTTKQGKGNTKVKAKAKTEVKAEAKTKVKAEVKTEVVASENIRAKIKKGKARNQDLPSGVLENGLWRTRFLPCLMYWISNSDYGWTVPETELKSVLEHIYYTVYPHRLGGCNFDVEELVFQLVSQRVHDVLIAFFASTPEYKTQEAREEYPEEQLEECRFVYEDPDNEEQPGAFLSEYILRIFASHLTAIAGQVRVDSLVEFGKPGYQTVLALSAVAAERALILVKNRLLVDSNPSDNSGKNHKIIQTLNEATNKMSHTGTAFSSGNWETDTMAYMDSIKDLPYERIQEILTRAEEYMKHPRNNCRSTADEPGSSASITPEDASFFEDCNIIILCSFDLRSPLLTYPLFPSPLYLLLNMDDINHSPLVFESPYFALV